VSDNEHLLDSKCLSADDVLLVPQHGELSSRDDAELYPFIYSAPMDRVTGYELAKILLDAGEHAVIPRDLPAQEWHKCAKELRSHPNVFFAISPKEEFLSQFFSYMKDYGLTGVNVAIDIAHGDSSMAYHCSLKLLHEPLVNKIMSGSVATPEGALRCYRSGCTHIRIGIGPGSRCTTREMTGFGVPQLSAVYNINKRLHTEAGVARHGITLIADGGIRTPGDAAKYLAAGADAIMMGSEFSRAIESPGWEFQGYAPPTPGEDGSVRFPAPPPTPIYGKSFRGCASAEHQGDHKGQASACPEGTSVELQYDGHTTAQSVIDRYRRGLASAVSYAGRKRLQELGPSIPMIQITRAAQVEGSSIA